MDKSAEKMKCWEGYERVPGTKPGENGSCRPKTKKSVTDEVDKLIEEAQKADNAGDFVKADAITNVLKRMSTDIHIV